MLIIIAPMKIAIETGVNPPPGRGLPFRASPKNDVPFFTNHLQLLKNRKQKLNMTIPYYYVSILFAGSCGGRSKPWYPSFHNQLAGNYGPGHSTRHQTNVKS